VIRLVTDGRTDGQTHDDSIGLYRASIASRGNDDDDDDDDDDDGKVEFREKPLASTQFVWKCSTSQIMFSLQ